MLGNIAPQKAIVKPRVISPQTGEVLPLEDLAKLHLTLGRGGIEIVGGPGTGKSTALAHLATLQEADRWIFVDDVDRNTIPSVPSGKSLVFTTRSPFGNTPFRLAKWTDDDLIEYLLATAPDRCADVLERFKADEDRKRLAGNPQLVSLVLEQMVACREVLVYEAFQRAVQQRVPDGKVERQARLCALSQLLDRDIDLTTLDDSTSLEKSTRLDLEALRRTPVLLQLLRHRLVRIHFASLHLVDVLEKEQWLPDRMLPFELIQQISVLAQDNESALRQLQRHISDEQSSRVAVAASILHLLEMEWSPRMPARMFLQGGHFAGANWEDRQLSWINLSEANLRESSLRSSRLRRARLSRTNFRGSNLSSANFRRAQGQQANFASANLRWAVLRDARFDNSSFASSDLRNTNAIGASFRNADFSNAKLRHGYFERANFEGANFDGADLCMANLSRAVLRVADLRNTALHNAKLKRSILTRSKLENVTIENADLTEAHLKRALLTGSTFHHINLQRASLAQAGLADVNWSHCDLQGVDFSNCSFQLGSTRCGHVDSPYPSHGTRTGFYTDDFDSHRYQSPEEVRKAALCDCDLRGADVEKADFYLVDLRGATYDANQEAHFRNCKAILDDWNGELP